MGKGYHVSYATSSQYSLQSYDYATQIGQIDSLNAMLQKSNEIAMLKALGVKFNENAVIFAVKDKSGKLYWLEKGNESVGLNHIIARHKDDFMSVYGVKEKDIPGFIKNLVISGKMISERTRIKNGRLTIQQNYEYNGKHYTINAIGTNGFIVSCYPVSE